MADTFGLELVTPERLLLARAVEMVVVPGGEGDFGVLPGHAPLVSALRAGILAVFDQGRVTERIFVAGGFAEVTPERCTVLAEEAMALDELDRARIEAGLKDARDDLGVAKSEAERDAAEHAVAIAEAKLAALAGTAY